MQAVEDRPSAEVVVLDGGIDLAAVPVEASLVAASAAQLDTEAGLVVDLAPVEFIDSRRAADRRSGFERGWANLVGSVLSNGRSST